MARTANTKPRQFKRKRNFFEWWLSKDMLPLLGIYRAMDLSYEGAGKVQTY